MTIAPSPGFNRRVFLAGAAGAGAVLVPLMGLAARAIPVVTLLGDSITAGYGLPAAQALPARLLVALTALGVRAQVRGAGVSGDTTADGLARVDFSVQPDTALCVVALGGNDLLQGLEPAATRSNLEKIARRLRARHMAVIIAGLTAPRAIGPGYARDFDSAFAAAARATGATLYPDFLAGVARIKTLNQADGIHPNAAGADIVARHMAVVVARSLKGLG